MPSFASAAVERRPSQVLELASGSEINSPPRQLARRKVASINDNPNPPPRVQTVAPTPTPDNPPSCPDCGAAMSTRLDGVWSCAACKHAREQLKAGRRGPKPGHRGRPPNPRCVCGTKMITQSGGMNWLCPGCHNAISKLDAATRFALDVPIPLRRDTAESTTPVPIEAAVDDSARTVVCEPPATDPGLNGDHETRAQERAKIKPTRPASNSRGEPETRTVGQFTIHRSPPPASRSKHESPLKKAIRALAPGEWFELDTSRKTSQRVRDALSRVKRRNGLDDLEHYLSEDGSRRIVRRKPAEGEAGQ